MREMTVAPAIERPDLRSVPALLDDRAMVDPQHVAFARRVQDELVDVSIADFRGQARELAKGLIAAGVEPGEPVAIMSPTCYEWALADFAIWAAGGVVVPIYETASTAQAEKILSVCGVGLVLAAGNSHRDVLETALPGVLVWTFDSDSGRDLEALVALGVAGGIQDSEVDRRSALAGPEDLASIVFTSGTAGRQKGVRITHANFVRLVVQVAAAYQEVVNDRASTIIVLPLAHVLAQGLQLVSVYAGMKIVHVGDPRSAVAAMAEIRPTFMVVVPRILEKIRAAAKRRAQEKGLGLLFAMAERTAVDWGDYLERAQDEPELRPAPAPRLRHALFEPLFYRRLRNLMGGRVDYLLSGASPLDPNLANFYRGVGLVTANGKNIAPEPWEQVVSTDPIVAEAIIVGENMPYAAALIVLDAEEAIAWAKRRGHSALADDLAIRAESSGTAGLRIVDEQILAHVQRTVDGANAAVSRAEQVRRFTVLITELSEESLRLTPTLKLRRAEFLEAMAQQIDDLYQREDES